jgi:hypothetical protein
LAVAVGEPKIYGSRIYTGGMYRVNFRCKKKRDIEVAQERKKERTHMSKKEYERARTRAQMNEKEHIK